MAIMSDFQSQNIKKSFAKRLSVISVLMFPLPIIVATNSFLSDIIGFSIYKLYTIFLFFVCPFVVGKLRFSVNRYALYYFYFILSFFAIGLAGYFSAIYPLAVISKINNVAIALLLAFSVLQICINKSFSAISVGWLASVFFVSLVLLIEIIFGVYNSENAFKDLSATFHNPNNLGIFSSLSFFVVMFGWKISGKRFAPFYQASICCLFFLILASGSRGALAIFLFSGFLYFMFFSLNKRLRFFSYLILFAVVVFLSLFSFSLYDEMSMLVDGGDVSLTVRFTIILNGIYLLIQSNYLGVGGGNFALLLEEDNLPFGFRDIYQPHNLWLEILVDYGVQGFFLFLLFYSFLAFSSLRLLLFFSRESDERLNKASKLLFIYVLAYGVGVVVPSHYVSDPMNWLFLTWGVGGVIFLSQKRKELLLKYNA